MENINEAIETILTIRDFCGNEREALADWEDENGSLSTHERSQVWEAVANEWSISQWQAGVKCPLSDSDRASAFADIESGV